MTTTTTLLGSVQVTGAPRDAIKRAKALAKALFGARALRHDGGVFFEATCSNGWDDADSGDCCFTKALVLDAVPFYGVCVLARIDGDTHPSMLRAAGPTITITIRARA